MKAAMKIRKKGEKEEVCLFFDGDKSIFENAFVGKLTNNPDEPTKTFKEWVGDSTVYGAQIKETENVQKEEEYMMDTWNGKNQESYPVPEDYQKAFPHLFKND